MLALFTLTTFLGAVLTFLLQPFVAKMVLPLFGGTPSVWNTCVLFFQAVLLAGYGYAHVAASTMRLRRLLFAHLCLLAIPLAMLPIAIGKEWAPGPDVAPVAWQLWLLVATAGLPFFAVSATAPLLQRWFSVTRHAGAGDPYFLYAASNLGSLMAILAYPFLLEPLFDLSQTSRIWTAGYVILLVLIAGCAGATWKTRTSDQSAPTKEEHGRGSIRVRLRWLALAFVPSSLMLSVTTHLSTDVAAVPLLWVVPLAIYLATYILAFAPRRLYSVAVLERIIPLVVVLLAIVLLAEGLELPAWALFPLHLAGLLVIALACHGQLADLRPPVIRLTEYYFWIAAGGLAGGVFNALIAPVLFTNVAEYPAALVMACLLRRPPKGARDGIPVTARALLLKDALPAALLGAAVLGLMRAAPLLGFGDGPEAAALTLGAPAVACYFLLMRPVRFALALAALLFIGQWGKVTESEAVFSSRTYYGLNRVRREAHWTKLYHGQTLHGIQSTDPQEYGEPLGYYHRYGPVGSLFRAVEAQGRPVTQVAVVGLGVGTLAAYGKPGQHWTFYELDPTVVFLARDSGYFTYWRDSAAALRAAVGDARVSLSRETNARYDLLILDAFSSDAVPAHLLTREALQLYRSRLAPAGTLAFHISNRFLDLEAVVHSLARDAGMEALSWADLVRSDQDFEAGRLPSHWIVLTGNPAVAALLESGEWKRPEGDPKGALWTDRFSNLLEVLKWSG